MSYHYWFGGPPNEETGDDYGAQYYMADPEANPGILWVTRQAKNAYRFPFDVPDQLLELKADDLHDKLRQYVKKAEGPETYGRKTKI